MGATNFVERAKGATAEEAFLAAREKAQWENGHGGYTGTIAEKHNFHMVDLPEGYTAEDWAYAWNRWPDGHCAYEKWGPAACVADGPGVWVFFGLASC